MNPQRLGDALHPYLIVHADSIGLGSGEIVLLAVALAAAFLSTLSLWRIGKQEDRRDRLAELRGAALDDTQPARGRRMSWYRTLGGLIAASPMVGTTEQERLLGVLAAAGIKGHGSLASFVAAKLCAALAWTALVWLFLDWTQWFAGSALTRLAVLFGALLVGWRIPDFTLSRLAARRRLRIEQGIPDALDLLVICAEAGLSLNQAIEEVSRQIRPSSPEVAEEFVATAAEMRVLSDVSQALDNLVQRSGIEILRSMIATLKQSMKFGTPLAESMRVLASDMRTARQARIEERAARLPVLLSIPLALFILPSLMVVIGTPVALRVMDSFKYAFGGQ